ncbi:MAG: glycosyltransferase family 4 protein [Actinobacteria bacterium]|nr:glycosyltransferase family 4 protein [Actinomycetota bacterium]
MTKSPAWNPPTEEGQATDGLRVLVVNQYFPPDTAATAATTADLAGALSDAGHRVSVLCGRPSYDPGATRPWRPLRRETHDGSHLERVGSTSFDRRNMEGRTANYLSYLAMASVRALAMPRPDVVVAGSDPPLAVWVALAAARRRPVVYVVRDLHPDAAIAAGWLPWGPVARLWERLHKAALRRSALIVCLGETMATKVRRKCLALERIVVVPDGGRPPLQATPTVVEELRAGADFVAMHAGNLGSAGAWATLVDAAERAEGVRLLFVGDGASAPELRARGAEVLPFRPESELASVMAAGDVQIVTVRSGMEGLVVPSKLYTALSHGRPVLAVAPGSSEVAHIVEQWRCGLVADPESPQEVARALTWMRNHPWDLEAMAARSRNAGAYYSRDGCLQRLVSLIEAAAAGGSDFAPGEAAEVDPGALPDVIHQESPAEVVLDENADIRRRQ